MTPSAPTRVVRVAAVQAAPALLDLPTSLERLEQWARRAVGEGARLIAFGETWRTGYPAWLDESPEAALWGHPGAKAVFQRLVENSVTVPGPAVDRLAALARELGVTLVVGMHDTVQHAAHLRPGRDAGAPPPQAHADLP